MAVIPARCVKCQAASATNPPALDQCTVGANPVSSTTTGAFASNPVGGKTQSSAIDSESAVGIQTLSQDNCSPRCKLNRNGSNVLDSPDGHSEDVFGTPAQFVDHYKWLDGASPETSTEELKRLYFEKLREFHPDKRPGSPGVTGPAATQALNDAWQVLRDPERRKTYDASWLHEQEAALPPTARGEACRRRGNELFAQARDLSRKVNVSLSAAQESLKKYGGAMDEYSKGLDFTPHDHKLWSNRALCYLAVEDWRRARDDATRCTQLRPDFMKGWFLLAKSLWKMGQPLEAQRELDRGLHHLPNKRELLELRAEISAEDPGGHLPGNQCPSRSVSPADRTPTISRCTTPAPSSSRPTSSRSPGVAGRKSPSLAGAVASSRQSAEAAAACAERQTSRSPATSVGPQSPRPPSQSAGAAVPGARGQYTPPRPGGRPTELGASGTYGNTHRSCTFGAPTPSFHQAQDLGASQDFSKSYVSHGLGSTCGLAGHSFGSPPQQQQRPPSAQQQSHNPAASSLPPRYQHGSKPATKQPSKDAQFISQRLLRKTAADPLNASRRSNGSHCGLEELSFGGSFGGRTSGLGCSRGVTPPPPYAPTRATAWS